MRDRENSNTNNVQYLDSGSDTCTCFIVACENNYATVNNTVMCKLPTFLTAEYWGQA